ncbi:pyrroline-5-carboxylate reductase [Pallidibacillus pasinlerensis]|uniref:Pyrroline-5-carboxylate reductase n=1 Tax=Pallidibacillus pasinlerensis TaxID=2703818 RepID=A0ABX0A8Q6_9BACI|nr:pyrroline-5-carboxylate reductase [Pallidibacillus pasinlerensis]NCU17845.1 pyrroline-5-carboxylate reductase [Pallidibacillus pasinlerensis]
MSRTIGFIGCGNIAKSMIAGIVKSKKVNSNQIIASNRSTPSLVEMEELYGIKTTTSNLEVAQNADFLFLTITADSYEAVISEIREVVRPSTIIVSVAAGESIQKNEQRFGRPVKLIKAMPNTPAMVNEGVTGLAVNEHVTESDKEEIKAIFESFGRVELVDESLMDVVTAVGGSSPAFTYMFIEALADGAVMYGMPRKQAYVFAAQAVLGAAKMMLETNIHPAELKDSVCSPGGTTIESVARLEERGLRSAVIEAVKVNVEKAKQIHG